MPRINVTHPFNYAHGADVKQYAKGEQDVPQAVADHAKALGFAQLPQKTAPKGNSK